MPVNDEARIYINSQSIHFAPVDSMALWGLGDPKSFELLIIKLIFQFKSQKKTRLNDFLEKRRYTLLSF